MGVFIVKVIHYLSTFIDNPYKKFYPSSRRVAWSSKLGSTLSSTIESNNLDDSTLRSHCHDDLLLNKRIACAISKSMTTTTGLPRSVKQALSSKESSEWNTAIRAEMSSMIDTRTLLPLSVSLEDIGNYNKLYTQLIFDKRYNPDGTFKKYRVRLVGRGDLQPWDTYQDTYAGTANATSINIVLAIAAELDLELEALDIKSAFLYPDYTGPKLIVKRPPGLTDDDMPEYMELGKCIYGLRQAAHEFRGHLDKTLTQIGFVATRADPCVYVYREGKEFVIACIHVDDIGLAGTSHRILGVVKEQLAKVYELSITPDMSYYLGMNIIRDRPARTITINQTGYIDTLIDEYSIHTRNKTLTPMVVHFDDDPAMLELLSDSARSLYLSKLGSLLYLAMHTRPDILYAVNYHARKAKSPTIGDMKGLDRILRYVSSSRDIGLTFHSGEGIIAYGTADAAYACHVDRKSHSGISIHIGRKSGSVRTISKKQTTTALSSTEAEFNTTSEAAKEIVWVRLLLYDLGFPQGEATILYEDNQSTIKLIASENYHAKTKHIDVQYHYVKEQYRNNVLSVVYLSTTDMTSDMLTKPLGPTQYLVLRQKLMGTDSRTDK